MSTPEFLTVELEAGTVGNRIFVIKGERSQCSMELAGLPAQVYIRVLPLYSNDIWSMGKLNSFPGGAILKAIDSAENMLQGNIRPFVKLVLLDEMEAWRAKLDARKYGGDMGRPKTTVKRCKKHGLCVKHDGCCESCCILVCKKRCTSTQISICLELPDKGLTYVDIVNTTNAYKESCAHHVLQPYDHGDNQHFGCNKDGFVRSTGYYPVCDLQCQTNSEVVRVRKKRPEDHAGWQPK